jgi:hypothetical protein
MFPYVDVPPPRTRHLPEEPVSYQTPLRLGLVALAVAALAACNDKSTQPSSSIEPLLRSDIIIPNCQVGRIGTLATMLLPQRSTNPDFDLRQSLTVMLSLTPNQLKIAQTLALKLATALGDPRILNVLRDPNGTAPPTKDEAIAELVGLVFDCVQIPHGNLGGAFLPGGGGKVISGAAGGDLKTRDGKAALRVPPGAYSGDLFFSIAPQSALAIAHQCLPGQSGVIQYNQCYDISASPSPTVPFSKPIRTVLCTLLDERPPEGSDLITPSTKVHNRLRIATPDHTDPSKITVYDRKEDVFPLDCTGFTVASRPGVGERMFGSSWTRLASVIEKVTAPFAPKLAWAPDGVGADELLLTRHTTVDPVTYETGFEVGEAAWTTSGFWHTSSLTTLSEVGAPTAIVNSAYPAYVALGAGDGSSGALPAPFSGSSAMWYGQDLTGNFSGGLAANQALNSGGLGVVTNSGRASSPSFSVPNSVNPVWVTLQTWYEIESQNPKGFDLMDVQVEDMATPGTYATITRLNPAADPTTTPRGNLPFTSGGFNTAPVWLAKTLDLSAYRGKTVRLHLNFDTRDRNYNGFRGWIVDQLSVKVALEPGASYSRGMAAPTAAHLDVVAPDPTVERVWVP